MRALCWSLTGPVWTDFVQRFRSIYHKERINRQNEGGRRLQFLLYFLRKARDKYQLILGILLLIGGFTGILNVSLLKKKYQ